MTKHGESAKPTKTGRRLTKEEALSILSERLFFVLERADPTGDEEWDDLPDSARAVYANAVECLLEERSAVQAMIGFLPKTTK